MGSKQVAVNRRTSLGNEQFEELRVMKAAWKDNLLDLVAWNSVEVEEIQMITFEEMLVEDEEAASWAPEEEDDIYISEVEY